MARIPPPPPRRSFADARCLVTGASSGLGRALAIRLARSGARVVLTGRSEARLEAVRTELAAEGIAPDRVPTCVADLTVPADRDRLIAFASDRFGGALDLLVNSAGVGATGHFDTHDPATLRAVFEINVFALAELTRAALPLMRAGQSPWLVNLGSIVARRGLPGRSEYSASKFAVAGFTESIRSEWIKFGIRVMLLNPGFTDTEFDRNLVEDTARIPMTYKRVMTADAVAVATLQAIRRNRPELTLTREGRMLLLVNRLAPRLVDAGMARFTRKVFHDVMSASRLPEGGPRV